MRRPSSLVPIRIAALVVAAAIAAGCSGGDADAGGGSDGAAVDLDGLAAGALAATPDGGFLVADRLRGVIVAVDAQGVVGARPVATVAVDPDAEGQRGLVGVVATGDEVYAAWTRASDDRLVVGQVAPSPERIVWLGPPSTDLANGGHLQVAADGRLLVGIGDLQDPASTPDPATPNGKLLLLDPSGPAEQVPAVVSAGWNNPYGFVVTSEGAVWVADNAPGERAERLGRGDDPAGAPVDVVDLPGRRAPSVLVELRPGVLGLCGFLDGTLVAVDVMGPEPVVDTEVLADGCRTGAVVLAGGRRVAVSDGEALRIVEVPG